MALSYYEQKTLPTKDQTFPLRQGDGNYIASEELKRAVDIALLLDKPLLLTGLPGTGKTDFAFHVAQHFNLGEPLVFHTQTSSVANDLLYRYNSLAHFQYSRHNTNELKPSEIEEKFIDYEALGTAIRESAKGIKRVVLIDEIDKAPRDLSNDILDIVDNMRFRVPELQVKGNGDISRHQGSLDCKPLLILTSNSEKALPEPFLRRCLFFYIEQPKGEHLRNILKAKLDLKYKDPEWDVLIKAFEVVQQSVRGKKPATAELILWAWWLHQQGISPAMLADTAHMPEDKKALLRASFSILAKDNEDWLRLQTTEIKC